MNYERRAASTLTYPRRTVRLLNLVGALAHARKPLETRELAKLPEFKAYDQANKQSRWRAFYRDRIYLKKIGIPVKMVVLDYDSAGYVLDRDNYRPDITKPLGRILHLIPYAKAEGGVPVEDLAELYDVTPEILEQDANLICMAGRPPISIERMYDAYVDKGVFRVDLDQGLPFVKILVDKLRKAG